MRRDVALLPATEIREQTVELVKGLSAGLVKLTFCLLSSPRSYLFWTWWCLVAVLVQWTGKIPVWNRGCGRYILGRGAQVVEIPRRG